MKRFFLVGVLLVGILTASVFGQQALVCQPGNQTVGVGQTANLRASGGDGKKYSWSSSDGNPTQGSGPSYGVSYPTLGSKVVKLASAGKNVMCAVNVVATVTTTIPTTTTTLAPTTTTTTTLAPTTTTISTTTTTLTPVLVLFGAYFESDPGPITIGQDIFIPVRRLYETNNYNTVEANGLGGALAVRSSDNSIADAFVVNETILIRGNAPGTAQVYFTYPGSNQKPRVWFGTMITVYSPAEETVFKNSKLVVYSRKPFYHVNSELELDITVFENISFENINIQTRFPDGSMSSRNFSASFWLTAGRQWVLSYMWLTDGTQPGTYKNWVTVTDGQNRIVGRNFFAYTVGQYPQPGRSSEPRVNFSDLYADYGQNPSLIAFYGVFPGQASNRDVRVLIDGADMSFWNTRYFVTGRSSYFIGLDVAGGVFPSAQHDVLLFFMNTGEVMFAENRFQVDVNPQEVTPYLGLPGTGTTATNSMAPTAPPTGWIDENVNKLKQQLGAKKRQS